MAKGVCYVCGKPVGGFFQQPGFACPGCGKLYCGACAPKSGSIIFSPTLTHYDLKHVNCTTCGRRLKP